MAIIDPREKHLVSVRKNERYELKLHEIAPEDIEPLGDRYIVELIDISEKVDLGWMLAVTPPPKDERGNPLADPSVEQRGVVAAVIIRGGNGHLLGLSDHPWSDSKDEDERDWASVPMFFAAGDVILLDYNARGRALKILNRECRIANQIDVLARVEGVRLKRVDGAWVPAE